MGSVPPLVVSGPCPHPEPTRWGIHYLCVTVRSLRKRNAASACLSARWCWSVSAKAFRKPGGGQIHGPEPDCSCEGRGDQAAGVWGAEHRRLWRQGRL